MTKNALLHYYIITPGDNKSNNPSAAITTKKTIYCVNM